MSEKTNYEPHRRSHGVNPHLKYATKLYLAVSLFALLGVVMAVTCGPLFVPRDPWVYVRWIVEKSIRYSWCMFLIVGTQMYYEWKTNGNLLGQTLQTPMSSAIFLSAVLLGVVYIMLGAA